MQEARGYAAIKRSTTPAHIAILECIINLIYKILVLAKILIRTLISPIKVREENTGSPFPRELREKVK
jgi:hypothetical protein